MVPRDRGRKMSFLEKQKKIMWHIPVVIITLLVLTFMIYDISTELRINKIIGEVVSSVNVSEAPPSYCYFPLYEGKNLISFHCISGTYPRTFLFENFTGDYSAIFSYDVNDASDHWKSYNPSLPSWVVQDLNWVYYDKGYLIVMNDNSTFDFEGILNSHASTSLHIGWNMIGYPVSTAKPTEDAFASIAGKYTIVLQYKLNEDTWYYYAPNDLSSTLTMIEPDYGYWIYINQSTNWVFP